MKKVVFCNMMMWELTDSKRSRYKVSGNSAIAFDMEVAFPINGVLSRTLAPSDDVKVVLLKTEDPAGNSNKNARGFMAELDRVNAGIGAKIEYKTLSTPHDERREVQEKLLKDIVGEFVEGAHVYVDITYGPKSLPIIMFAALNFAERFFRAEIKNIVYGKADFDKHNKPFNHELFDMTALFYLNSIASTIECNDGEEAKKMLDAILEE